MKLKDSHAAPYRMYQDAAAIAALVIFFLLYFSEFLFGEKIFAYQDDNAYLLAPTFAKISMILRHGALPMHVDSSMGGLEFYNSAQFSIFYPFYPFYFTKLTSGLYAAKQLNLFTLLHILLGATNCYILARTVGGTPLGALVAGLTFCAADNTRIYATWINITAPYGWVPLILCGVIQLYRQRFKLGYSLVTLGLAMTIAASPSQPMIHALLLLIGVSCCWLVLYSKDRRSVPLGSIVFLCLSIVTVSCICAPVIVPTGLEMSQMIRWLGASGSVIGNTPLPFEAFLFDEAPVHEWIRIFINGPSKSLVGSSFIGLLPGLFAVVGLFTIRRNPAVVGLALVALYAVLSSYGTHSGMAYVNYQLPLINKIREPGRHLVLFVFAASSLAAIGVSFLQRLIPVKTFCLLLCVGIVGHFYQMRVKLQRYPFISEIDAASQANQEAQAVLDHIHSSDPNSFVKIVGTNPYPMFFGMHVFYVDGSMKTVDGYYNPQRYSNHRRIQHLNPSSASLMKLSGITHLVCRECPADFDHGDGLKIASNSVLKVDGVRYPTLYSNVSTGDNPFVLTTSDGDIKPVSFDEGALKKLLEWPQAAELITVEEESTNYKRFAVSSRSSSLFIADNLFSVNWKYFVNGNEVESYPVNFMRQGIVIEPGQSKVEMKYSPRHLTGLFVVSVFGVFLFMVVLGSRWPIKYVLPQRAECQIS